MIFFSLTHGDTSGNYFPPLANDPVMNAPNYSSWHDPFFPNSNIPTYFYANQWVQFGMEYSDLLGLIVNSKVTQKIGEHNAAALELDYGDETTRVGATWGIAFSPHQLIKVTAERFTEQLPFTFVTGEIQKTIPQYAVGSAYEYLFANSRISDVNLEVYYADAQSKLLNPIDFITQGSEYIDYRHIAGATSEGGAVGVDINPWTSTALGVQLNYDQVDYHPLYILQGTTKNDDELGVTVNLQQLLTSNLKLNINATKRAPYDEYGGSISWLMSNHPFEIALTVNHLISHNSTPSETDYLISATFALGDHLGQALQHYMAPSFAVINDLGAWTNVPAVHMDRVLAAVDEIVKKVALLIDGISPNSGPDTGGTVVTISGTGFVPGAIVSFGGLVGSAASLTAVHQVGAAQVTASVQFVNPQTLLVTTPAHAAGTVDVTVSNPDGSFATLPSGFTFVSTVVNLQSIDITPVNASVSAGFTQQYLAIGHFSNGTTQNITNQVTWSSSNTAAATINNHGQATTLAVGVTTIKAVLNGVTSNLATLTVTNALLQSITISAPNSSIAMGTQEQFTAIGHFSDHSTQDITTQVNWSSSNTGTASINSVGVASAVNPGSTVIKAQQGSITSNLFTLTVTNATLTSIAITPVVSSIPVGLGNQFTAIGTFSDNTMQDLTTQVNWNSSNPNIATINSVGHTLGVMQGSTIITANFQSITSNNATLTVTPPILISISVTPVNPSVAAGLTQQFMATGTYSDGSMQNLTTQVTWASSNTALATVSASGLASTHAQGSPTISATLGSVVGSTVLNIGPPTLVSISVTPANPTVALGLTEQFTATGTFTDGSTQNLTTQVAWASSDTALATVSASGLASTHAQGSPTISATLGSVVGSTVLNIGAPTLVSISVTPANPTVALGLTEQFTATGTFTDGSTQNLTTQVTWASSNTAQATISASGLASTHAQGSPTISATLGSVVGSTVLNIGAPTLVSISVTPANPTVALGLTQQFTATGTFTDGSTQNLTTQVTWASSNTALATVSASGLASTHAQGSPTISATLGSVVGSTVLNIGPPTLVSISVTPANPTVALGLTEQFTATGTFTDGSMQNLTTQVTWASSNTALATVSASGLASTHAQGSPTISATLGSVVGSTVLNIGPPTLVSISVTPVNPSIASGSTQQFTATGTFTDGSMQNLTTQVTWASSNTAVATISGTGLASGLMHGTSTISATLGSVSGNTNLTVTTTLTSIVVTPANATIRGGTTQQYTATGHFSDGSTMNLTTSVTWSSTVITIATINSAGLATGSGVNSGSTSIQAVMGSVMGSTLLTVTQVPSLVSILPTFGSKNGGYTAVLMGNHLTGVTSVSFNVNGNIVSTSNISVVSDIRIDINSVPASGQTGIAAVTATNISGTSNSVSFNYQ